VVRDGEAGRRGTRSHEESHESDFVYFSLEFEFSKIVAELFFNFEDSDKSVID